MQEVAGFNPQESTANAPIIIHESAVRKTKALMEMEKNDALMLRLFITGGGCSGFQYGFAFEEKLQEDDLTIRKDGMTLVIDSMSVQYLNGAEVSYNEGLEGAMFIVKNPNAKTTCGCGSSFSI